MDYWIIQNNRIIDASASGQPLLSALEHFICPPSTGRSTSSEEASSPITIAAVGAGGKSSLLLGLLREAFANGQNALLTTTTHMFLPESLLEKRLALGTPVEPEVRRGSWIKCRAPEPEQLTQAGPDRKLVLIEADGSRKLPLKLPETYEPVIPDHTDCILAVYGLSALGKPFSAVCHRYALLTSGALPLPSLPAEPESPVTPRLMGTLMREAYLKPLSETYPDTFILPVWNQADTPNTFEAARLAAEQCGWPVQLITHFPEPERSSFFLKKSVTVRPDGS